MPKKRKALHVLLACLALFACSARKAVAAIDLKKLEKKYALVGSVESDFTQEVYQATLARTKSSKGVITLSKPLLVRWEIHEPERSVMVSNGVKVWYYTPKAGGDEKGQVIIRPAKELAANALIGILNGTIPIEKEFTLKEAHLEGGLNSLVLTPKKAMGDITEVVLGVNDKYLIKDVKLVHRTGNRTKISLQNTRLGAKLPTNLFKFSPPPGTNVVTSP